MSDVLTVGSLFAGIGGIELGLERTGRFRTVWQVENDSYANKVLAKHWPEVRRYGDIRTLDAAELERVDVICGGFPCQPHSLAGKRKAGADERDLWGEFARVIRGVRPRYVLAENVPGLLSSENGRFFGRVLRDLASCGYDAEWQVLPAAAFGAPHIRERVYILAHSNGGRGGGANRDAIHEGRATGTGRGEGIPQTAGWEAGAAIADARPAGALSAHTRDSGQRLVFQQEQELRSNAKAHVGSNGKAQPMAHTKSIRRGQWGQGRPPGNGTHGQDEQAQTMAHTQLAGLEGRIFGRSQGWADQLERCGTSGTSGHWAVEPPVGRVANGVPSRVDRLRCLGNAVVPAVAQYVGECIIAHYDAVREAAG